MRIDQLIAYALESSRMINQHLVIRDASYRGFARVSQYTRSNNLGGRPRSLIVPGPGSDRARSASPPGHRGIPGV